MGYRELDIGVREKEYKGMVGIIIRIYLIV